jgi:hypothetical protein
MTVQDFGSATIGQTLMFIDERQRREADEWKSKLNEFRINRLNTWIIARTFGLKQNKPEEMYNLPDETPTKKIDPFSKEANDFFERMDKAEYKEVAVGSELAKRIR